jgi:hypothetical protein
VVARSTPWFEMRVRLPLPPAGAEEAEPLPPAGAEEAEPLPPAGAEEAEPLPPAGAGGGESGGGEVEAG